MATKAWAIILMFITTGLTSVAQIFYKKGTIGASYNLFFIGIGLTLYAIGAVIMIIALKGGEVSVLYPIIATSYIWVSILSIYFYQEPMNFLRWLGVITIIAGITFISFGSKKTETIKYTEAV